MRRNKLISLAIFMMVALYLVACEAPKTKQFTITSEPQGATIIIDGEKVGQTPMKRDLKYNRKKERYLVIVTKKGYEHQQRNVYRRDDSNVLFILDKAD